MTRHVQEPSSADLMLQTGNDTRRNGIGHERLVKQVKQGFSFLVDMRSNHTE